MEQFSAAELPELVYLSSSVADTQFQYWLTVTFAVVVAAFAAGKHLDRNLRGIAVALYLLTSFILIARFFTLALGGTRWLAALDNVGVELARPAVDLVIVARILVFALGTVAASYFLLKRQE